MNCFDCKVDLRKEGVAVRWYTPEGRQILLCWDCKESRGKRNEAGRKLYDRLGIPQEFHRPAF